MKQLICANEATYEVCNETVCFPSGSANVRNVLELWMPESAMAFDEFEALCKDGQAMQRIVLKEPKPGKEDEYFEAVFEGYTLPVEIAKKTAHDVRCKHRRNHHRNAIVCPHGTAYFHRTQTCGTGADVRWR